MRILAVDDDPVILDLLKESLTAHEHYDLVCCSTGEEALTVLQSGLTPFDCFLLDIMLPGIDGVELCDRVRQMKEYRTTPIVMITASREPDLMGRAFYAGATDFLPKPLNGVELGARINSAGMLNDSLHRERQTRHTLDELTAQMKVRFDEQIKLSSKDVTNLASLENDLLRLPTGCYSMTLFSIDVLGLRGIHRAVKAPQFRAQVEAVAEAACAALDGTSARIAYAGSGRFMGVIMGRRRLNTNAVLDDMTSRMTENWNEDATGTPMPPQLQIAQIGDQRILSGLSASDVLRTHLVSNDLMQAPDPDRQDRLFSKFDRAVG